MQIISSRPRILIVDDSQANITVLEEIMKLDYDVSIATNGHDALKLVETKPPQLILLDIMMPDMDGYEVCQKLKENPETESIPVIFITAKCSANDETKGFDVGGVDYIKKPFRLSTVRARVKNHLQLKQYQDHLNELVAEKTGQLIHSDRLATLGTLSSMVAHEIKNPLFFISGNAEMAKHFMNKKRFNKAIDKIDKIIDGSKRIEKIIETLKSYSKPMSDLRDNHSILAILHDARTILNYKLLKKNVSINISGVSENDYLYCNIQKLSQVFVNLFVNAIESFTGETGLIDVSTLNDGKTLKIIIADNGTGIPESKKSKIFEPFISTKTDGSGTGLGLYIVKHIVEEHDGDIALIRSDHHGTEFVLTFPVTEAVNNTSEAAEA